MSMLGRMVLYRPRAGARAVPAIVVHDWGADVGSQSHSLNLQVILDGTNERSDEGYNDDEKKRGTAWRTSIPPEGAGVEGQTAMFDWGWQALS